MDDESALTRARAVAVAGSSAGRLPLAVAFAGCWPEGSPGSEAKLPDKENGTNPCLCQGIHLVMIARHQGSGCFQRKREGKAVGQGDPFPSPFEPAGVFPKGER